MLDNSSLCAVSDSSGRYRGQFIFGNVFWMGSKEFCQDVNYHNQVDRMAKKKKQKAIVNMHYLSTTLKLDLYSLVNKVELLILLLKYELNIPCDFLADKDHSSGPMPA